MYDIYQFTKTPLWGRFCSAYGFRILQFYIPLLRLSLLKMRLNSLLALAAVATTAAASPSHGCWDHETDAEGHCPHHKDFRFLNERTRRMSPSKFNLLSKP